MSKPKHHPRPMQNPFSEEQLLIIKKIGFESFIKDDRYVIPEVPTHQQPNSFKERIDASSKAFKEAMERELAPKSGESKAYKVFHKMLNTNEPVRTGWVTDSFEDKARNQRIAHNKIKTQMRALIRIAKEVIEEVEKTKPDEILLTDLVAEEMLDLLDEIIITTLGQATTQSRF